MYSYFRQDGLLKHIEYRWEEALMIAKQEA